MQNRINLVSMKIDDLQISLANMKQVGPKRLEKLHRLGLRTVWDLLHYVPVRYDDLRNVKSVADVLPGEKVTVTGEIAKISNFRSPYKRMVITTAKLRDESGVLRVVWFNQGYLASSLKEGTRVQMSGTVREDKQGISLNSPVTEVIRDDEREAWSDEEGSGAGAIAGVHTGRLVPIYSATEGITSRWLRYMIHGLLEKPDAGWDYMPADLLKKEKLIDFYSALHGIHFPKDQDELARAKERLAFDELLLVQFYVRQSRGMQEKQKGFVMPFERDHIKNFISELPFVPTKGQKRAAWDILQDFEKPYPMNRLLEGDVGTGKTTVVAIAAAQVIYHKMQAAVVAPTEVLAVQHYETFVQFFEKQTGSVGILTRTQAGIDGNECDHEEVLRRLADGSLQIVIGTHALLQDRVAFSSLAFVVVDEQHRFGVGQRSALIVKGKAAEQQPHFLSLSATPIPRTLALSVYGNLAISRLTEFPKGERQVVTKIISPRNRAATYEFLRERMAAGKGGGAGEQLFVIVPLVEESKLLDLKNAQDEFKALDTKIFPQFKVGLVHGRKKAGEIDAAIKAFRDKKLSVLVATTVVEVGVDIPDASLMIIEGAERFGLAQLHQLRGRIGRNNQESYCFLFPSTADRVSSRRLKALEESDNGFELAEIDLKLRGPGEFLGTRQSGVPGLRVADLTDLRLVQRTKHWAEHLLSKEGSATLAAAPDLQAVLKSKEIFTYID